MEDLSSAHLVHWGKKGGLALLDQGLFSGANFLVNILLARWLAPEEYGAFAVAYSIFLLLAAFHTAVLTEPMMIFGAGKYVDKFSKYLGILLYGHWGITGVIVLILGVAALIMAGLGSVSMAKSLGGLAIAAPFLLLLWLTRRGCYVHLRPQRAVAGSVANLGLTLGGLFLLLKAAMLSSFTALVILALGGLIASLLILFLLRPQFSGFSGNPTPSMVLSDHWGYGSWNLLGVAAYWASGQILIVLIPVFLGLGASAAVAATWNIFRPISLAMQSMSLLVLPTFSKFSRKETHRYLWKRLVIRTALLFAGGVLFYGIVMSVFAKPVLNLLYQGKYDGYWLLVTLFAISSTASAMIQILVLALKSANKVELASAVWGVSAIGTLILGVPLMLTLGLEGALGAFAFSYILAAMLALSKLWGVK